MNSKALKFSDIEQNTEEWQLMRCPRLTSSKLNVVMAHFGKAFSEPAKRYAKQIAIQRVTGKPTRASYKNDEMDRGHDEEPIARMLYEERMFSTVSNGGFFYDENIGCSPDGLVSDSGVIEIKSVGAHTHYDSIIKGSYDTAYKWQLIGNLKFTGREWIDFISYCSEFEEGKELYVFRLHADQFKEEFSMIDERAYAFLKLVDGFKEKFGNMKCYRI